MNMKLKAFGEWEMDREVFEVDSPLARVPLGRGIFIQFHERPPSIIGSVRVGYKNKKTTLALVYL